MQLQTNVNFYITISASVVIIKPFLDLRSVHLAFKYTKDAYVINIVQRM